MAISIRGDTIGTVEAVRSANGRVFDQATANAKAGDPVGFLQWVEDAAGGRLRFSRWYMDPELRQYNAMSGSQRDAFLRDAVRERWSDSNMPQDATMRQVFTFMLNAAITNAVDAHPEPGQARRAAAEVDGLIGRSLLDWVRTKGEVEKARRVLDALSPADYFAAYDQIATRKKGKLFVSGFPAKKKAPFDDLTHAKARALAQSLGLGPNVTAELVESIDLWVHARDPGLAKSLSE